MSHEITALEKKIINSILDRKLGLSERKKIKLNKLELDYRDPTGVGLYIHFKQNKVKVFNDRQSSLLGFNGEILALDNGREVLLGGVLDIEEGAINYLELFTYGSEAWDKPTIIEGKIVSYGEDGEPIEESD